MDNNRTHNSVRNMIFGTLNRLVGFAFPFIMRTVFIKTIGEEYLGLNTLYSSILQVISLADLGFANAIVASMYKPIAEHNVEKVDALLNLYKKIYRTIGTIILLVGLSITPFVDKFISGTPPKDINIYSFWVLYLLNSAISYMFFAYRISLMYVNQRGDITDKISTIFKVLTGMLQIFVIVKLRNVYLYVILNIVFTIAYNIGCARASKKYYPEYSCKGQVDESTRKKITKDIGALTFQKIGSTVSLSLDSIIISSFLGLSSVAIYGNYNYVITGITSFTTLIYGSITASIGNSIAIDTKQKNYDDFKKIFFLNMWIIGWCCVCFMCLFQDFMTIWMGKSYLLSIFTVFCLVFRFFAEQMRKVVLTYKDAAGIWWYDRWRPIVACVVNLTLNIALVNAIGIAGVAISTVVSYLLVEMPWETHILFKHYFKTKEFDYYKEMLGVTISIIISGLFTYVICFIMPLQGVLAIVVKLLLCVLIFNGIFIIINYKNKNFIESKVLILKVKNVFLAKFRTNS